MIEPESVIIKRKTVNSLMVCHSRLFSYLIDFIYVVIH
ncbi:hypothetical protein A1OE_1535 [Candidatus Endolissoclinum faulkneri L2]|uniref:Uncharacterized protein n=1 Tax=Candidatus Endolissoclinum faulkneri L2 TaxID=1193729 RepID=K7Z682_9PROT|nr:hypothetical protein A1OE_1535 [Candidatus Endolissoclinum faulkneri L2]